MDELHYDPIDTTVSLIANIVSLKNILPDDEIVMMLTKIYKNSPIKHITVKVQTKTNANNLTE